ncbi:MAG: LysR family transcriptional regulator [Eubacteriaceae bacterium]
MFKIDLFNMKCYLSVAKHLNLSIAAKETFISQPAMSLKLNTIEEDLGVKLLKRSRHKVELTNAGKFIQKEFSYILNYYEKVKDEAKKISVMDNNHLSIGYHGPTEWAKINYLIENFHKKYPHIIIDVTISGWGPLTMEIINASLDVIFVEKSEVHDISILESQFLFRDYGAIAVSKSSPLAKYKKITAKYLENEKIIMSNTKSATKSLNQIHKRLTEAGFNMQNAKLVDCYETTIAMASANMGVAPIPRTFKIEGHQSVCYVDIDSDKIYEDFVLTWSKNNEKSSIVLFKEFCKQHEWQNILE